MEGAVGFAVVGAEPRPQQRVIEGCDLPAQARAGLPGVVATALGAEGEARPQRFGPAAAGEELDDAGHGVGAEERRLRAPHYLHALQVLGHQVVEEEGAAGLVQHDAVQEHFVVITLAAADEQRGDGAETAAAYHGNAGQRAQQFAHRQGQAVFHLLPGDHAGAGADLGRRRLRAGGGDDHLLPYRRQLECYFYFRPGCDVAGRGLEADQLGGQGVGGGRQVVEAETPLRIRPCADDFSAVRGQQAHRGPRHGVAVRVENCPGDVSGNGL